MDDTSPHRSHLRLYPHRIRATPPRPILRPKKLGSSKTDEHALKPGNFVKSEGLHWGFFEDMTREPFGSHYLESDSIAMNYCTCFTTCVPNTIAWLKQRGYDGNHCSMTFQLTPLVSIIICCGMEIGGQCAWCYVGHLRLPTSL